MEAKPYPEVLDDRASTRLWSKVNPAGCCWWWEGTEQHGYGVFSLGKRNVKAHRLVYSLLVGDPGPGIDLDHVCRTTLCVNPDHLDPVTITVNNERTTGFRQRSTHCPRGHRYSEHGRLQDGYPACRICDTDRHRERRN